MRRSAGKFATSVAGLATSRSCQRGSVCSRTEETVSRILGESTVSSGSNSVICGGPSTWFGLVVARPTRSRRSNVWARLPSGASRLRSGLSRAAHCDAFTVSCAIGVRVFSSISVDSRWSPGSGRASSRKLPWHRERCDRDGAAAARADETCGGPLKERENHANACCSIA